jgi:ZIP family zinc transporter
VTFFVGDTLIDRAGGARRKSPVHGGVLAARGAQPGGAAEGAASGHATASARGATGAVGAGSGVAATGGLALVLGALLDGIPESAAIGISLLDGQGVGVAMVAAVFLSNVPESLSATTGLKASGRSTRWILGLWALVCLASTLASLAGYALLGDASAGTVAFIQTFAAGAILTMLADTMLPEAVEHAGPLVGLFTVMGFAIAFLIGAAA